MGQPLLILLDTHVVVWLAQDYRRISPRARSAIAEARRTDGQLAVSDITLLEIALFASRGRLHLTPDVEAVLAEVERRFVILPITSKIAQQAFKFPASYSRDPADRVIGATALVEGISLLTADREIRKSRAVPTIW